MTEHPLTTLFGNGDTVATMSVGRMAECFVGIETPRLRLPPIQRSLVWSNEQILNYWDSLLRGYPPGLMMVHRAKQDVGRNAKNQTETVGAGDFHLFDGQQRLTAILLGFGEGPLSASSRIWVDLGQLGGAGDRLFRLRINSEGQPFGYRDDAPNRKYALAERREQGERWRKLTGEEIAPSEVFAAMAKEKTGLLNDATCAVSLQHVLTAIAEEGDVPAQIADRFPGAKIEVIAAFVQKARQALASDIVLTLVSGDILDEREYARFFQRLGQGGTRLSEEELIYSLIKHRYPHIHDRMQQVASDGGRLASEINLVLAALRIAKTLCWKSAHENDRAGRPSPKLIERLRDESELEETKLFFLRLVEGPTLANVLTNLRIGLQFDFEVNERGLPSMLLGRFPRDLIDVLLLFALKRGDEMKWEGRDRRLIVAFALHWLLFVDNDEKAAYRCFAIAGAEDWIFSEAALVHLIRRFEADGLARYVPREEHWDPLSRQVEARTHTLAKWGERFSAVDAREGLGPGEALRVLSTHSERIKRALLWLQRAYIVRTFPRYDPTSTRDEDLPIDLDHAIPQNHFGYHWSHITNLALEKNDLELFRWERSVVGNSLGNYRWLSVSANRGRGKGQIEPVNPNRPVDDDIDRVSWNALIRGEDGWKNWSKGDVEAFQKLIDARTLRLARRLIEESGISELVRTADGVPR